MNAPHWIATTTSLPSTIVVPSRVWIAEKSTPPRAYPMGGMRMSLTSEFTTAPSAPPMITPIASARALDLVRNSLKPPIDRASVLDDLGEGLGLGDPARDLGLRRHAPDGVGAGGLDLLERGGE